MKSLDQYICDNFPSYNWTAADEHNAQIERDRVAELAKTLPADAEPAEAYTFPDCLR